jgi:hypothetical protein
MRTLLQTSRKPASIACVTRASGCRGVQRTVTYLTSTQYGYSAYLTLKSYALVRRTLL